MRVLVVEDERDTAEALSWGLTAEGYVVDVAGNGVDGLWKATENAYDVIVLDVMLPGLDGYQVARRLREAGRWTPILMLTAMDDDLDHAEGLDSGADDYLPKPFSYPVLLAHLRSLTRRTLGARPAVLAAAGLSAGSGRPHRHPRRRSARPDQPGGRGAGVPPAAQGTRGVQDRAARALLGRQLRRRAGRRRGSHAPAAPQDRAARAAAGDPDRARRGLHYPGPGMTAGAGRVSAPPRGWRRLVRRAGPGTVRARVTAVAGLALTAAVVLGLVVMYRLQLNSADSTIQGQLRTYATQIEQSAASWHRTRTLPPSVLDPTDQAQVLAPDGTVLAGYPRNLAHQPALYTLAPGSTTPVRQPAADRAGLPSDLSDYGEHATAGGQPVTIITITSTYLRSQVDQTFARLLIIGVPFLLVLAGGTVWLVVGRALRPVEQIRGAVTAITSADLSQRVPEPGTDDEIGRLARTMNDMLARLEDAAARQRRFVADASHELRSPLTAIRTGLEVGLSHPDRAPWPQIADRAVRQSQRLEQLIAELLVLAKADAHRLAARRQPVDLAVLLADLAATPAPGVSIGLSVAPGTATTGNPEDLSRMFRNLLDNAVRYARHRVLITAAARPEGIVVEIADDGPGIPAEERERVFGRFVRLDASREQASGSAGLGLAIAREIAAAHGATIVLTEAPGGGTRAVVTVASTAGAAAETTIRSA